MLVDDFNLATQRLNIRAFAPDDAHAYAQIMTQGNDSKITDDLLRTARDKFARQLEKTSASDTLWLAAFSARRPDRLVLDIDFSPTYDRPGEWDLAYMTLLPYRRQHMMLEALGAVMPAMVSAVKNFRVNAMVRDYNEASVGVVEKSGFRCVDHRVKNWGWHHYVYPA